MPKLGMEPIRREALVQAAIAEIGAARSLDVTVAKIADRAGMSAALAHHYFGNKDGMFLAAMRRILRDYSAEVRAHLARAQTPAARAEAIIRANFAPSVIEPEKVAAWMTFYVQAQSNPEALRLLKVYQSRLRSNLTHTLRPLVTDAKGAADLLAALIDGFYIRAALTAPDANPEEGVLRALTLILNQEGA